MSPLVRPPQGRGEFRAGAPASGYYNDLSLKARDAGTPSGGGALLERLTADRRRAYPITIAQLGLGAWQVAQSDPAWLDVVERTVDWLDAELEDDGRILCLFAMPHTFTLEPPWASAMAQGEVASLLVRAAGSLDRPELLERARLAVAPLLAESSELVTRTPEGPVLQEYPTDPPSHVLNGWIFALWGLYDVAHATGDERAAAAFDDGVAALTQRLHLYDVPWAWSRYDLLPRRLAHAASPFYHRLHIAQLGALADLSAAADVQATVRRWESALRNPAALGIALARKVAFRMLTPRRHAT